ncbi:flagellar biosynthesis anti-sigma factor FlgM [Rhodanobacter sp. PCA2]|uniref:flagellar biosynthesis anti-sigma factor FlgM n=1 Tax=Rhodanobacter sp. PCA2 TaxID=2006117 RepID=UPI0015E7C666|nr:flagellar biosynthesis anti-sigma factor FlgM [Rhodanobacter sp. PCA2]MBA2079184.1 flagellar biosynthesis anti-sigma factor FlgM [Rhodanobacter sp. PCA2]
MSTTISNNGLPKLPQVASQPGNGAAAESSAGVLASEAAPTRADDQLKLTDSAKALQQAARTDATPVDSQRVERVRQALADGSYKIDANRIADRLLAMERQLGGVDKS